MNERRQGWVRSRVLAWLFPVETPESPELRQLREAGYYSPAEDISAAPETVQPATGVSGTVTSGPATSAKTGIVVY